MSHREDSFEEAMKKIGYWLVSFVKEKAPKIFYHEICIAIKQDEYTLLDKELINLDDVASLYKGTGYRRHNQAMLVCLGHNKTKEMVIVGNAHLYYNPAQDQVRFAQAHFILDKAAAFCRKHTMGSAPIPFIMCGDWNSHPVSSVLSAIYGEDIEDEEKSSWTIPYNYVEPKIRTEYKIIN